MRFQTSSIWTIAPTLPEMPHINESRFLFQTMLKEQNCEILTTPDRIQCRPAVADVHKRFSLKVICRVSSFTVPVNISSAYFPSTDCYPFPFPSPSPSRLPSPSPTSPTSPIKEFIIWLQDHVRVSVFFFFYYSTQPSYENMLYWVLCVILSLIVYLLGKTFIFKLNHGIQT